jgi:hypothetical protein
VRSITYARARARDSVARISSWGRGVQGQIGGKVSESRTRARGGFKDCTRAGGRRGQWGVVRGSAQSDKETKDRRDFFFTSALLHHFDRVRRISKEKIYPTIFILFFYYLTAWLCVNSSIFPIRNSTPLIMTAVRRPSVLSILSLYVL